MKKPVRSRCWHLHLHILLLCRANWVLLRTLICPIPWPPLPLPSIPQELTRRTWNCPPLPATQTAAERAMVQRAKCKSREVLAASNVTASKRLCEDFFNYPFYLFYSSFSKTDLPKRSALQRPRAQYDAALNFFNVPMQSAMSPEDQLIENIAWTQHHLVSSAFSPSFFSFSRSFHS